MHQLALAALHTAAEAICQKQGVVEATADNDQDSGEIIFSLVNGETYVLKLAQLEPD